MIGIGLVNAQISKVTGNVTSEEDGLPVVGASVLVKGTTVGTVTDIDGNFTLTNVPSSAGTLVISFIGMLQILRSDTDSRLTWMCLPIRFPANLTCTGEMAIWPALN